MKDSLITVSRHDLDVSPAEARAARISAEFRDRPAKVKDYIAPANTLREHILRLSLFPNIYNRKTVLRSD